MLNQDFHGCDQNIDHELSTTLFDDFSKLDVDKQLDEPYSSSRFVQGHSGDQFISRSTCYPQLELTHPQLTNQMERNLVEEVEKTNENMTSKTKLILGCEIAINKKTEKIKEENESTVIKAELEVESNSNERNTSKIEQDDEEEPELQRESERQAVELTRDGSEEDCCDLCENAQKGGNSCPIQAFYAKESDKVRAAFDIISQKMLEKALKERLNEMKKKNKEKATAVE